MEMYIIGVAFEILEDGKSAPVGYTKVSGNLTWSVKMDFTRKARWVLDGHKTPDPVSSKYAGVGSRESVQIAFIYAALNGLDVYMADIRKVTQLWMKMISKEGTGYHQNLAMWKGKKSFLPICMSLEDMDSS